MLFEYYGLRVTAHLDLTLDSVALAVFRAW
jgi:hypothetical protein